MVGTGGSSGTNFSWYTRGKTCFRPRAFPPGLDPERIALVVVEYPKPAQGCVVQATGPSHQAGLQDHPDTAGRELPPLYAAQLAERLDELVGELDPLGRVGKVELVAAPVPLRDDLGDRLRLEPSVTSGDSGPRPIGGMFAEPFAEQPERRGDSGALLILILRLLKQRGAVEGDRPVEQRGGEFHRPATERPPALEPRLGNLPGRAQLAAVDQERV
jgi:hypothetical protein